MVLLSFRNKEHIEFRTGSKHKKRRKTKKKKKFSKRIGRKYRLA